MKTVTVALVAGFTLVAGAASASAEGLYAGFQLGISGGGGEDIDFGGVYMEFDTGGVFSGFVGKDYGNIRAEAELAYRQNDMDNYGGIPIVGEMSSWALMGNGYYDFGTGSGVTPYVGFGMGLASVTMNSVSYNTNDTSAALAVQFMGGAAIPVTENIAMTMDLRYFFAAPEFVDLTFGSYTHGYDVFSLMIGVRSSF